MVSNQFYYNKYTLMSLIYEDKDIKRCSKYI